VDEVAAAISHEMGIDAMNTNSLLVALSDRESSPLLGVVIDAIDEAVTPDRLVRDLLVPLARMAEQASVRLLIGTRPGLDRRFVRAFDRDAVEIDLDDACYLDPDDIVAYAERLLLTTDEDGNLNSSVRLRTPYRQRPELVVTVARAIADQAGRSFLVTYLSSLALLQAPRIVDTTQPGWETELPHNAGEAVDYYLDRFGTDRARVRDLLTPLAFAEGDGIGNPEVWAKVATVLGTATYVATDVAWLLSETTASDLLSRVENEDDVTDPVTYRLFHEALAEYFRDNLTSRMSRQAVSRAFAEVLVKIVPTRLGQSGRQWSKADYYTRTYLAVHAAAGGMFDDLVCDFSFLAVAEPSRLLQALPSVHTAQGRRMTEALTRIGRQLLSFPESERIPYLQLATRKSGYAELADQADSLSSGRPWSVPWARWTTPAAGRTIGHHSLYIQDLSLMPLQGRVIVATAEQGAVRLWDLKSGRSAGEFVATEFTDIVSMTIIATDQGPQVVTGHIDDTIVFWNPIDESRIVRKTRSTRGRELVSLAHDLLLSDGPDGSLMLWKASNTSLMASIAVPGGAVLWAAGRVGSTDFAVLHHYEQRSVYLWNLSTQESIGEPLTYHNEVSLWECAIGSVYEAPVVFTAFAGKSCLVPDGLNCCLRKIDSWPDVMYAFPGRLTAMSVAMNSTAEGTIISIGDVLGKFSRFILSNDRFVLAATVEAHDGGVDNLAFSSHDGRLVEITGGRDGAVRLWQTLPETTSEMALRMDSHTHVVTEVGSRQVLVGPGKNGGLSACDVTTGTNFDLLNGLTERLSSRMANASVACRVGDCSIMIVGYDDGTLAVLNLDEETVLDEITVSDSSVESLGVVTSSGPPVVVCATADGAISSYNLTDRSWIARTNHLYDSSFAMKIIDFENRRVGVTSGYDISSGLMVFRIWDIDAGIVIEENFATLEADDRLFGRHEILPMATGYVDGQAVVVCVGGGSAVRVWDLRSGELIRTGFLADGHQMVLHDVSIGRLCGHDVIISGGYAGALSIWNLRGDIFSIVEIGHSVSSWWAIPPGGLIVSGHHGTVRLDLTEGFLMKRFGSLS